jgi:arylsulfatase
VKRSAAALAALLAAAVLAGCGGPTPEGPAEPPRHVFLLTVDTLRADHLGAYGYPRDTSPTLDALAADGVLFERAFAQWPKTGPSFASIFTGRYPHTSGLTHKAALRLPDAYLTLPELFSHAGYTTAAVVSNGVLAKRLGWDQGFDEYHQTWSLAPEQSDVPEEYRRWINAPRVNELALPLLERHKDTERLFVWIHYSDPHAPYLLPEGTQNPFVGDEHYLDTRPVELENPRATALGNERELRYYVAAYDANIRVTDDYLGEVLEQARGLGLLEDALLVMTADHGESLGEHGYYFGHGRLPHNPGSHVPLIFVRPGTLPEGRRVARPVEMVDLYPTLRELLMPEHEVPGLEGESLVPWLLGEEAEEQGEEEALAFSNAGGGAPLTHYRSVQDATYKLIFHPQLRSKRGTREATWRFYDLARDPGEEHDLLAAEEGLEGEGELALRRMRRRLTEWMGDRTWIKPPKGTVQEESEETLKTLRALGYIQ